MTLLSPLSLSCLMTVPPDVCERVVPLCSKWSTTPKTDLSLATLDRETTGRASDDLMAWVPVVRGPIETDILVLVGRNDEPLTHGSLGETDVLPREGEEGTIGYDGCGDIEDRW
jgi:hypothetical protein